MTEQEPAFRDSIGTVSKDGKRVWMFPKKVSGKYYQARTILSFFLLAIMFFLPLIKVNGRPFILLNVIDREFILFGLSFGPHDFFLFLLIAISTVVFIVLFTAVWGRIFCGWLCPQTVFMEMVFRKIEYWIDGDAKDQRKLRAQPMNAKKFGKRLLKFVIFYTISFLIAHTFLSYIIGFENVIRIVTSPPAEHWAGFTAMMVFTFLFFFVFWWFREQACIIVCPYGRLQGVLLDHNSLAVTYDFSRGEPRGKLKKGTERSEGDCIDCHLCVDVCPTGIDIRDGIQLECVNCTACMDVCDSVMEKVEKPKGLIRYASLNNIKERLPFRFTGRIMGYTILLVVLVSVTGVLLATRTMVEAQILRQPGSTYNLIDSTYITNFYTIQVTNKTFDTLDLEIRLKDIKGEIKFVKEDKKVMPQKTFDGNFILILNRADLKIMNTPIYFTVYADGKEIETKKTSFMSDRQNTQ